MKLLYEVEYRRSGFELQYMVQFSLFLSFGIDEF